MQICSSVSFRSGIQTSGKVIDQRASTPFIEPIRQTHLSRQVSDALQRSETPTNRIMRSFDTMEIEILQVHKAFLKKAILFFLIRVFYRCLERQSRILQIVSAVRV
jgi:hypothetical protein